MKTVFKKTLIATAALAFVGTANAAQIRNVSAETITALSAATYTTGSAEGLAKAASVTLGTGVGQLPVYIKPTVTNVEQDVLIIQVAGAKFDTTATPVLTGAGANAAQGYDFFDYQGEDTIRFRVKSGGVTATALAADHFVLSGAKLKSVAGAGGKVTLNSKVVSLNPVIGEYDKGSFDILKVAAQVAVEATTSLSKTVATAKARKQFTTAGADTFVTELTNNTAYFSALTVDSTKTAKVSYVLSGDWSFVRDADKTTFGGNANGALSSAEIATIVTATPTAVVGADTFAYSLSADNKLTVTQTVVGAAGLDTEVTFTVNPAAVADPTKAASATALNAGAFAADVTATTDDSAFAVGSAVDIGAWKIDGSVVKVPYLVLQDGRFGTVVTVSNSGSRTGEILLDIVDEAGVSIASGLVAGSSTPGSIVNVSGKIRDALVAKGKDLTKVNKFSVTVTTNVPAAEVLVYSAYTDSQNGGERAIVNNDSAVQYKGANL